MSSNYMHKSFQQAFIGPEPQEADSLPEMLQEVLRALRTHLDMDVAFMSEFTAGRRVFRYVDAGLEVSPIQVGDSDPLEESYCQRIIDGRLPQLIKNTAEEPATAELPATETLAVANHLGVPIRLADGSLYGTFCCFSNTVDPTLGERDLNVLQIFADFAGTLIDRHLTVTRTRKAVEKRIASVLDTGAFNLVYQPIFHFGKGRVTGFEVLTRFTADPPRSPDVWFKEAASAGLGDRLEMAVISRALHELERVPDDLYISLNVSPEHILSGAVEKALERGPVERIVLEVTEHDPIPDYRSFNAALERLRWRGLCLAVDDAGAGYASFRHILSIRPDYIKLDMSLTRNIHADASRRALAAALITFGEETGARIIAEGVETPAELVVLKRLGVEKAQGYLVSRPLPIDEALMFFQSKQNQFSDQVSML